jgi:hypothetical protein
MCRARSKLSHQGSRPETTSGVPPHASSSNNNAALFSAHPVRVTDIRLTGRHIGTQNATWRSREVGPRARYPASSSCFACKNDRLQVTTMRGRGNKVDSPPTCCEA